MIAVLVDPAVTGDRPAGTRLRPVPVTPAARVAALAEEAAAGAQAVWLLGPGVVPTTVALDALRAAGGSLATGPLLRDGVPVAAALPDWVRSGPDGLIAAVAERRLPIAAAAPDHLLVPAATLAAHGAPDPRDGALAIRVWTGRVLRDAAEPGWFVPAAALPAPAPLPPPPAAEVARAGRALRGLGAWGRLDVLEQIARPGTRRR